MFWFLIYLKFFLDSILIAGKVYVYCAHVSENVFKHCYFFIEYRFFNNIESWDSLFESNCLKPVIKLKKKQFCFEIKVWDYPL